MPAVLGLIAIWVVGFFGFIGAQDAPTPTPTPASVSVSSPAPSCEAGDDNCDGRIDEDESGWDCKSMGNHTCGSTRYVQAEDGSWVPESFYASAQTEPEPDTVESNDAHDPNRGQEGYVQAEDGSWVKSDFYDNPKTTKTCE